MGGDDEREKMPVRVTSTPDGVRRIDVRAPRPAREEKRASRPAKVQRPRSLSPRPSKPQPPKASTPTHATSPRPSDETQTPRPSRPIPRTAAVPGRTPDGRSSAPPEVPPPPPPPPTPRDDVSAALALVGAPQVRLKETKKKDKPQTAREALKQRAQAQRSESTRPPQKTQRTGADELPVKLAKPPIDPAAQLEAEANEEAAAQESGGLWRRVKGWFGGAR